MTRHLLSALTLLILSLGTASCGSDNQSYENNVDTIVAQARKEASDGNTLKAFKIMCDNLSDKQLLDSSITMLTLAQTYYEEYGTKNLVTKEFEYKMPGQSYSATLDKSRKHLTVTFSDLNIVKLFDFPSMNERLTIHNPDFVYNAELNADSTLIAVASGDNKIYLYEFPSGQRKAVLTGHTSNVRDVCFTSDGVLISGSNDHRVKGWDTSTMKEIWSLHPHSMNVKSIKATPDGTMFATCANDGSVQTFLQTDNGTPEYTDKYITVCDNYVNDVDLSPDGSMVAAVTGTELVKIFNTQSRRCLAEILLDGSGLSTAFSPDGRKIAVGSTHSLFVIDTAKKEIIFSIKNTGKDIWSVQFIDNNSLILSDHYTMKVIKVLSDKELVSAAREFRKTI